MYLNVPAVGTEYWIDDVSVEFVEALTVSPSKSTTTSPVTTDRMLYCGAPSKCEELGGDEAIANMYDQHVV